MKRRMLIVVAGAATLAFAGGLMAPAQAIRVCVGGDDRQQQGRMVGYCAEIEPNELVTISPDELDDYVLDRVEDIEARTRHNVEYLESQVRVDIQIPPIPPTP